MYLVTECKDIFTLCKRLQSIYRYDLTIDAVRLASSGVLA
jgi:hypothetical protein